MNKYVFNTIFPSNTHYIYMYIYIYIYINEIMMIDYSTIKGNTLGASHVSVSN